MVDSYSKIAEKHDQAEKNLTLAKKQRLAQWNKKLTANTFREIEQSISLIGRDAVSAIHESESFSKQLLARFETTKAERYENIVSNGNITGKEPEQNIIKQKPNGRKPSRDSVVAKMKQECLRYKGNKWDGNSCHVEIEWGGRACYDPSGKYCKTGETLPKNLSRKKEVITANPSSENNAYASTNNSGITGNGTPSQIEIPENSKTKITEEQCKDLTTLCVKENQGWENPGTKKYASSEKFVGCFRNG